MKCKFCHKNVRNIGHFMRAHKALMQRRSAAGRKKGLRAHGGRKRRSGRKTASSTSGHYCPVCGKMH